MPRPAEFSLLLGLLLAGPAQAGDEVPDVALLEFLGEWEDDQGEWVDPLEFLQELQAPAPEKTDEKTDETQK